jgi:hypothetical protein
MPWKLTPYKGVLLHTLVLVQLSGLPRTPFEWRIAYFLDSERIVVLAIEGWQCLASRKMNISSCVGIFCFLWLKDIVAEWKIIDYKYFTLINGMDYFATIH